MSADDILLIDFNEMMGESIRPLDSTGTFGHQDSY